MSKRPQPKQTFSTSGDMTSSKEDTNCLADPSGYFQNYFHAWPRCFHNTKGEENNKFERIKMIAPLFSITENHLKLKSLRLANCESRFCYRNQGEVDLIEFRFNQSIIIV